MTKKIGYGATQKQIAKSCWGHLLSSRHDFPDRSNADVLAAVAATYDENARDYDNMIAALLVLEWIKIKGEDVVE